MECKYCQKSFSTKGTLITHQRKAKYCLKIQGEEPESKFVCKYCDKEFNLKLSFDRHIASHESNEEFMKYQQKLEKLEYINRNLQEIINLKDNTIEEKNKIIEKQESDIREYRATLERVAIKAVTKPTTVNNTINYIQVLKNKPPLTLYHKQLWLEGITDELINDTNISQAWGNLLLKTIGDVNHLVDDSRKKTVSKMGKDITDVHIRGDILTNEGLRYFKDYGCTKTLQFLNSSYQDIKQRIIQLDRLGELTSEQLSHRSRLIKMIESIKEGQINEDMNKVVNHFISNS